jgi:hypothetical protein
MCITSSLNILSLRDQTFPRRGRERREERNLVTNFVVEEKLGFHCNHEAEREIQNQGRDRNEAIQIRQPVEGSQGTGIGKGHLRRPESDTETGNWMSIP